MSNTTQKVTDYQKNRDKLLQKSKNYYENNKEQRKKYQRNKYNNVTDGERLKVLEYRREWYHKLNLERKREVNNHSNNKNKLITVN